MKRTIPILLVLILAPFRGFSQSPSFAIAVHGYEERMNQAALSWARKSYGRALDAFKTAHEVLNEEKPSPSDTYSWRWYMALTSFTKLMERLVEIETMGDEEDSGLKSRLHRQAREWSGMLAKRIAEWEEVGSLDLNWIAVRSLWTKRFRLAIQQADRLPMPDSSG